jgi:hypothetical protein
MTDEEYEELTELRRKVRKAKDGMRRMLEKIDAALEKARILMGDEEDLTEKKDGG